MSGDTVHKLPMSCPECGCVETQQMLDADTFELRIECGCGYTETLGVSSSLKPVIAFPVPEGVDVGTWIAMLEAFVRDELEKFPKPSSTPLRNALMGQTAALMRDSAKRIRDGMLGNSRC